MYNKDVSNTLIREFGIENAILYCKMEYRKNDLLYQDAIDAGVIGSSEIKYERDWWEEEEKLLKTLKNNKNGNIRVVRNFPKNSNSNKAVVSFKNVR
jgi:hypothetical protein